MGADALTFKTLNPDNEDFYTRLSYETSEGKMLMPGRAATGVLGLVPGGAAGLSAAQPLQAPVERSPD